MTEPEQVPVEDSLRTFASLFRMLGIVGWLVVTGAGTYGAFGPGEFTYDWSFDVAHAFPYWIVGAGLLISGLWMATVCRVLVRILKLLDR